MESSGVLEEHWKKVQAKTFTKWINTKLRKAGMDEIIDLYEETRTGLPFVQLFKAMGKAELKHNPNPKSRIAKMENVTFVLDYIKSQNVVLVNIGSPDIVDGDQKLVLGLVWTIISRMSMTEAFDNSCYSIKNDLLAWVQKVTEPYDNVSVKNFTTGWKDGLAFNAIIHRFRPEYVNYSELTEQNPIYNLENAFTIAENKLDIPQFLDPEDVAESIVPDEKSIMTYVFELYKKFKPEENKLSSKSLLNVFLRGLDWSIGARNDYCERAKTFSQKKEELEKKGSTVCEVFLSLMKHISELEQLNNELIGESSSLHLLMSDISDTDNLFGLKPFVPPAELLLNKMDVGYQNLNIDLSTLAQGLESFNGAEAQTILKLRDTCNDFLSIGNKQEQVSQIASVSSLLSSCKITNTDKNLVISKLNDIVVNKKVSLNKFTEYNEHRRWVLDAAKKLFMISDVEKTGAIGQMECKKIIRALKYDINAIPDSTSEFVTLDSLLGIVENLLKSIATPAQVRTAFEVLGENGTINLVELDNASEYKNLGLSGKTTVDYTEIVPFINE
ncbi:actinin alpha 1/4 [Pancytospora epiphaga]|nr:actinin alpha 1/4 [Pancytospora epiphaga]